MEKEYYISSAQELFDWLCASCGIDWNKVITDNKISGSLGSYGTKKSLFNIWSCIQKRDGFLAWKLAVKLMVDLIGEGGIKNPSNAEELRNYARFLNEAAGYIEQYNPIRQEDRKQWSGFLRSLTLLTEEEKTKEDIVDICPRSMQLDVDKILLEQRMLRICRYKGEGKLQTDKLDKWVIGENFIMAENVSSLFFLNRPGSDDTLKIYVTLNIEAHLDYSYFLIAINQGDNWWMVTDEAEFANPSAKEGIAHRSAYRYREDNFTVSVFPYIYLDKIEEYREKNRQIQHDGGMHREMYTVSLKEWPVECRVMLELLLHGVIRRIAQEGDSMTGMKFVSDYMASDRLLTGKVDSIPLDELDKDFKYSERCGYMRERIKEMILRQDMPAALVKVDREKVNESISLFAGSLMTEEKYHKLQSWALCKEEFKNRKRTLETTEKERIDDIKAYTNMLDRNISNLFETLFAAKNMWVFIYEPGVKYGNNDILSGFSFEQEVMVTGLHCDVYWPMVHARTTGGAIDTTCRHCNRHPLKEQHTSGIRVTHWSMLAWLAGVKREQLPFYLCNYASDGFHTYIGNSLLDNINPLYSLKDDMSNKYRTGAHFGIRICKRCRNALAKKAMEEGVLVINKNTCQAEGVFTMEDFTDNWLPSKGIHCKRITKQL